MKNPHFKSTVMLYKIWGFADLFVQLNSPPTCVLRRQQSVKALLSPDVRGQVLTLIEKLRNRDKSSKTTESTKQNIEPQQCMIYNIQFSTKNSYLKQKAVSCNKEKRQPKDPCCIHQTKILEQLLYKYVQRITEMHV